MNCENYILLLDEYLNNELEERLHGSVSNHLAICEDCRDEIRLLKLESGFYQNVETIQKRQFINQWDAMRNRLVAESLIRDKDLPAPEALKYQKNFLFLQTFFARLENLFLTNKTAFGVGLLIIFGIFLVFLLIGKNNLVEKKFEAAIQPKQSAEFEVSDYSTDHKSISSNKTTESAETKFTNQTEKNLLISRMAINDKSQFINRANKKFTKSKTNLIVVPDQFYRGLYKRRKEFPLRLKAVRAKTFLREIRKIQPPQSRHSDRLFAIGVNFPRRHF